MNITSIVAKKCSQVNKKQKINESIAFVSSFIFLILVCLLNTCNLKLIEKKNYIKFF